ncbi:MAG: hybrid sensor histidine kinase/response regulator [Deltaproteobacteria bacterium]|nr:hybrid sensor histidine kinase/response regulator [Deltaproteobacteria bacterium]
MGHTLRLTNKKNYIFNSFFITYFILIVISWGIFIAYSYFDYQNFYNQNMNLKKDKIKYEILSNKEAYLSSIILKQNIGNILRLKSISNNLFSNACIYKNDKKILCLNNDLNTDNKIDFKIILDNEHKAYIIVQPEGVNFMSFIKSNPPYEIFITTLVLMLLYIINIVTLKKKIINPLQSSIDSVCSYLIEKHNTSIESIGGNEKHELAVLRNALEKLIQLNNETVNLKQKIELQKKFSDFAGYLLHDIRKPFSTVYSIINSFDKIKNKPELLNSAKNEIKSALTNVDSMIDNMLDYSRRIQLKTRPNSINSLLLYSLKIAVQGLQDKDISFKYDLQNNYKPLVNFEVIVRAFSNIISNALEAITITGKKNSGLIMVSSRDVEKYSKKYVEISIYNDGPSISEKDISKLFDSFFTKGKQKGTGIGLASCLNIVTLHNGIISTRNVDDDKGVEFVIDLPCSKDLDHIDKSEGLPSHINEILLFMKGINKISDKKQGDRVVVEDFSLTEKIICFIADDSEISRLYLENTIEKALSKYIPIIYTFEKPEDILAKMEEVMPDIIICDNNFDHKSDLKGEDLFKIIRKTNENVSLYLASNHSSSELKSIAENCNADGFFAPDISAENLQKKIISNN